MTMQTRQTRLDPRGPRCLQSREQNREREIMDGNPEAFKAASASLHLKSCFLHQGLKLENDIQVFRLIVGEV